MKTIIAILIICIPISFFIGRSKAKIEMTSCYGDAQVTAIRHERQKLICEKNKGIPQYTVFDEYQCKIGNDLYYWSERDGGVFLSDKILE